MKHDPAFRTSALRTQETRRAPRAAARQKERYHADPARRARKLALKYATRRNLTGAARDEFVAAETARIVAGTVAQRGRKPGLVGGVPISAMPVSKCSLCRLSKHGLCRAHKGGRCPHCVRGDCRWHAKRRVG